VHVARLPTQEVFLEYRLPFTPDSSRVVGFIAPFEPEGASRNACARRAVERNLLAEDGPGG
jgi:hypothetical protein